MSKFRKKPVVIDAFLYAGDPIDVARWMDSFPGKADFEVREGELFIKTLEGEHHASKGDFIIRGVAGEYYPCKPDIFHETYEAVGAHH